MNIYNVGSNYMLFPTDNNTHLQKNTMYERMQCVMHAMVHTTATIFASVSCNTRTTETIDHVGATSTVLAWIRTAFVDFYNTRIQPKTMTVHTCFMVVTLIN